MASGIEEALRCRAGGKERQRPQASPRSKRAEIVAVATECFGENGYEDTKWAEVAEAVGLGPTALYHYFESKQQCLFEILGEAIGEAREHFVRLSVGEFAEALPTVVRDSFVLDEREVMRARVLVAEQGLTRHQRDGAARGELPPARLLPGQGVRGGLARSSSPPGWRPARSRPSTPTSSPAP